MNVFRTGSKFLLVAPLCALFVAACAGELDNPDKYKQSQSADSTGSDTTSSASGSSASDTSGLTTSDSSTGGPTSSTGPTGGTSTGNATATSTSGSSTTGGTTSGGTGAYMPPACIVSYVKAECALSGCHNNATFGINMSNLASDALSWVGHAAVSNTACAEKWIDPANYQNSLMWDKVANPMPKTGCGASMPFGSTIRWDQTHLDCMMQFLQGAIAAASGM